MISQETLKGIRMLMVELIVTLNETVGGLNALVIKVDAQLLTDKAENSQETSQKT